MWVDASSLAVGCCIECEGNIIEDIAWIRSEKEANHINLAELEAALKGVNMAIKWGFKKMNIKTDSATVFGWIKCMLDSEKRVKVSGLSEVLVKRRLCLLLELIESCELTIQISKVGSNEHSSYHGARSAQ